jgi:chromatin remodeling complex protein RSC6
MAGINDKREVSDDVYELTGKRRMTRGEVVKAIWAYAAENDLKTTKKVKGRNTGAIKADEVLSPIIGKGIKGLGDIAKAISDHLY